MTRKKEIQITSRAQARCFAPVILTSGQYRIPRLHLMWLRAIGGDESGLEKTQTAR
jgi:hypothetical protein